MKEGILSICEVVARYRECLQLSVQFFDQLGSFVNVVPKPKILAYCPEFGVGRCVVKFDKFDGRVDVWSDRLFAQNMFASRKSLLD